MSLRKIQLSFPSEVLDAISATYQNNADVIKEAAVLDLYREGKLSSGKAAEILDMDRFEFIRYAGMKGIPYIRVTPDELEELKKEFAAKGFFC
jgi:predicted HTH domain antitoxin